MDSEALLDALDRAEPESCESIYSRADVTLTRSHVQAAIEADRPCAVWLMYRYEAGPPGRTLPSMQEAFDAVANDVAEVAHAYVLLMLAPPLEANEFVLHYLRACLNACWRTASPWFTLAVAERVALAAIAMGEPELAWQLLDDLSIDGEPHPQMQRVAWFASLRRHPELIADPLVRAIIVHFWPATAFASVPTLPWPEPDAESPMTPAELRQRLSVVGAEQIAELLDGMVHRVGLHRMRDSANASYQALRTQVREVAASLGDPTTCTEARLRVAVARIDCSTPDLGMILCHVETELSPLERVLEGMALAERLDPKEFEEFEEPRRHLLDTVQRILPSLSIGLMPMRVLLLDELLDGAAPEDAPFLLYQRANSRRAAAPLDPGALRLALADLDDAIELADGIAQPDVAVQALALRGAVLVQLAEFEPAARKRLDLEEQVLRDRMAGAQEPETLARLSVSLSSLARARGDLDAACEALATAIARLDDASRYMCGLEVELVTLYLANNQPQLALQISERAMTHHTADLDRSALAMLHIAHGRALVANGEPRERVRTEYEAALSATRGRELHWEIEARLLLAALVLEQGDLDEFRTQRTWLAQYEDQLAPDQAHDLLRIDGLEVGKQGDRRRTAEILDEAIATAPSRAAALELRLRRAGSHSGRYESHVEDRDALLLAAVAEGRHEGLSHAIEFQATAWLSGLRPHTLEALLEWCGESRPIFAARLHAALGRHDRAQEILQDSLSTLTGSSRMICLHDLIVRTPDHEREALARWCDELESALEDHDEPHVRLDLASRLRLLAHTEQNGLTRALAHVARATSHPLDPEARRFADSLRLEVLVNLVDARSHYPTAELAVLARELLADSTIAAPELARARLHAALSLSKMGALCHAQVIAAAEALLEAVDEATDSRFKVAARWDWIRSTHAGQLAAVLDEVPAGPLDDVPQWLIAMFDGRGLPPSPAQLTAGLYKLDQVLTCRSDLADEVAAQLLTLAPELEHDALRRFELALIRAIEAGENASAWPHLHAATSQLQTGQPGFVRALADTLARRRGEPVDVGDIRTDTDAELLSSTPDQLLHDARQASESALGLDAETNQQRLEFARERYERARQLFLESGDIDGQAVALIGIANTYRYASEPDFELALSHFDAAARLGDLHPDRLAQLWKVQADALLGLGGATQLRRAGQLLDQALEIRQGRYRAETLLSAAEVAEQHPDASELERVRRASEFTMQAMRLLVADESTAALLDSLFRPLVHRLARWRRLAPNSLAPQRMLDELDQIYPQRGDELRRAREGVVSGFVREDYELFDSFAQAPNTHVFMHAAVAMQRAAGSVPDLEQALEVASVEPCVEKGGQTAAIALLVLELARQGQRTPDQARASTQEAMSALRTLEPARTTALMLATLALHWVPGNHRDDFGDASLALQIAELACELDGGLANADDDVIEALARAHRYLRTDDTRQHLELALRLYEQLAARAREQGRADAAALALNHMGEVESELAHGDRRQRLLALIARQEQALALAASPKAKAELQAMLAWYRCDLAGHGFVDDPLAEFERAQELFDGIDWDAVNPAMRPSVEDNQAVCKAGLAARREGPRAEVAVWRARLDAESVQARPYATAMVQHNLATALWRCPDLDQHEYRELLLLAEDALSERTRAYPRHHWETTLLLGTAYLATFTGARPASLRIEDEHDAWRAGVRWLEAALVVGQQLGPGEELSDAALSLAALACWAPNYGELERVAERAWTTLQKALPYLLSEPNHRARELAVAEQLAFAVARFATSGLNRIGPRLAFVLEDDRSTAVVRWLRRAQAAARRPLWARLHLPSAVPIAQWRRWQQALDSGDGPELARSLAAIHEFAPQYLVGELELERTWQWLQARTDAAAISVHLRLPWTLCVILEHDRESRRRQRVVVLDTPSRPGDERSLSDRLAKLIYGGVRARAAYVELLSWVREHVCSPIEQLIGRAPSTILWAPGPILRLVAPTMIWPNSAVVNAMGLGLPELERGPGRHRSTLLAVAMSEADHVADARPITEELAAIAEAYGSTELLVSLGPQFGRAAFPAFARVRESSMSARALLSAAREHDVIAILAHGFVEPNGEGGIVCVGPDGSEEILDVTGVASDPNAFAGATVVLLSCETGRVAGAIHQPGGVAGILLAAGARMVVAPLWPVGFDVARDVARAILDGIARGHAPSEVLPAILATTGPRETELQRRGYVCWIG